MDTLNGTNCDISSLWTQNSIEHSPKKWNAKTTSQYLEMPDGVNIAIDVILPIPIEQTKESSVPCLMIMARYWRSMSIIFPTPPNRAPIGPREMTIDYFVSSGFAVVVVDGRGSGASTGKSSYPWSREERQDYAEVAKWIIQQIWSNGKIGAYGISYEGTTALFLAETGLQAVHGVIAQEIEFDVYTDIALPGGILNDAFIKAWSESNQRLDNNRTSNLFPWLARFLIKGVRPVDEDRHRILLKKAIQEHSSNTDVYNAMRKITYRDDQFGETGVTLDTFSIFKYLETLEQGNIPIFLWGSWLDSTSAETVICMFNNVKNTRIGIIGAWKHEMTAHGSPYLKPNSNPTPSKEEQWKAMLQFFTTTLNGDNYVSRTLYYYTLGEEKWKKTEIFPPPNAEFQTWYFQKDLSISRNPPVSATDENVYHVDFKASTGKLNRWQTPMARPLLYPNRARADKRLLVYTSQPLEKSIEITGYPKITLHISSTHADGAFFVYLEDVDEKGYVRYLTEGELRGIHRKLREHPAPFITSMPYRTFRREDSAPLPVGESVELVIGLQPTSAKIKIGHRIRIAIGGADKDTFARIPEHGNPTWTLYCNALKLSKIELPIIQLA